MVVVIGYGQCLRKESDLRSAWGGDVGRLSRRRWLGRTPGGPVVKLEVLSLKQLLIRCVLQPGAGQERMGAVGGCGFYTQQAEGGQTKKRFWVSLHKTDICPTSVIDWEEGNE
jgi:hypothetical protein